MADILLLNGPNLNLLGLREPDYYGSTTLEKIVAKLVQISKENNTSLTHYQHNSEGELIDRIHQAIGLNVKYIIINPAGFSHTSIALRDALLSVDIPFIEIHISNIYKRESFRQHSYFSDIAMGVISGFGAFGYEMALDAVINNMRLA